MTSFDYEDFSPNKIPLALILATVFTLFSKCHVKKKDIRKFLNHISVSYKAKIEEGDNYLR
ncbi:hypothetical protein OSB04_004030 [Centaurea solstitialis]|uniref:Uncharacterized protein n=1 Tax=Centaurea solstitialis TaxID=347529 RepID=A0AA38TWA5_9ASTR|nr:hypothetical protein OSB04_004030 [Centaurea solstitialis]